MLILSYLLALCGGVALLASAWAWLGFVQMKGGQLSLGRRVAKGTTEAASRGLLAATGLCLAAALVAVVNFVAA